MIDIVVTRESIRIKTQRDHENGVPYDQCPFWETSEAAKTWREEWRRLDAESRAKASA